MSITSSMWAVVGPDGAAISPDHAQGVPMVRVAGIDAAERPSVAMLDGYDVLVIGADVFDGELAFEYFGAGVYDILTAAPVDEMPEPSDAPVDAPIDAETLDDAEPDADDTYETSEQPEAGEAEEPAEQLVADEAGETDEQPASVWFEIIPESAVVTVRPAAAEEAPEQAAIPAQADGSFLLPPGDYACTIEAEGYRAIVDEPFTVEAFGDVLSFRFELLEDAPIETAADTLRGRRPDEMDSWSALQEAIDDADDGDTVMLGDDLCAEDDDCGPLLIPEGKSITLDLNGYALSRDLPDPAEDGCVIIVEGDLILVDEAGGGLVTGGNNSGNGGGIFVSRTGSLTLDGAAIESNATSGNGGGVYAEGAFTLNDGTIQTNTAQGQGGGVWFEDECVLKGGNVLYNAPEDFHLVRPLAVSGKVKVSNAFVANNSEEYVYVEGKLSNSAGIRFSAPEGFVDNGTVRVTKGLNALGGDSALGGLENFSMDNKNNDYDVALDDSGEIVIGNYAVITLEANDGRTASKQVRALRGSDFPMPDCPFNPPDGMPFQAWLVSLPEGDVLRKPGETIPVTDDIVATAQWAVTWSGFQQRIDAAGEDELVQLSGDLIRTDKETGAALTIGSDVRIVLDLAGCVLDGASLGERALIYVDGGELVLTDSVGGSKITGGTAGGVVVNSGKFTLRNNVEISGNRSNAVGGGVAVNGGQFVMEGGSIADNTAQSGGGVAVNGGSFVMQSGSVERNTASANGGGVAAMSGAFTMKGGDIRENSAANGGGASVHHSATLAMTGGALSDNTASENGGGLWLERQATDANGATINDVSFTLGGGEIDRNTAGMAGGGVYGANLSLTIDGTALSNNAAVNGGGVAIAEGAFTLKSGKIRYSTASGNGGGVYAVKSDVRLSGGSVSEGSATMGGGAFLDGGSLAMPENIITGNVATAGGAGLALSNMKLELPAVACVMGNTIDGAEADYWLDSASRFNVTGQLDKADRFHVSTGATPDVTAPVAIAGGEFKYLSRDNFVSVNPDFISALDVDGNIVLGVPVTVRFKPGEGSGEMDDDTTVMNCVYTLPGSSFTGAYGMNMQGWVVSAGWDDTIKAEGYDLLVTEEVLDENGMLTLTAQWGKGTLYVDERGTNRTTGLAHSLSSLAQQGVVALATGWYLADGATFDRRVSINGNVNIIIENAHVTTMNAGIYLPSGSTLTIWAEGGWERSSGKLVAMVSTAGNAGIGGNTRSEPGTFELHTGVVEATGGTNGAGIGTGCDGDHGTINIKGGNVTAISGQDAAGIGGGDNGYADNTYVENANVYAYGEEVAFGAGKGSDHKGCLGLYGEGTVYVSNTKGVRENMVTGEGKAKECRNHKYAEVIYCTHPEVVYSGFEYVDDNYHDRPGLCYKCHCVIKKRETHRGSYVTREPLDYAMFAASDRGYYEENYTQDKYHVLIRQCVCEAKKDYEPEAHNYKYSFSQIGPEPYVIQRDGDSISVKGDFSHLVVGTCVCGYETITTADHNYGKDKTSKVCLDCGAERPPCTISFVRGENTADEAMNTINFEAVPGTYFEMPELFWPCPSHTEFDGWMYDGNLYRPYEKILLTENAYTFEPTYIHEHDGLSFKPWTAADRLPRTSIWVFGDVTLNYFLTCDVTLDYIWNCPGNINLCLNGHSITCTDGGYIAVSGKRYTLNIYDEPGNSAAFGARMPMAAASC